MNSTLFRLWQKVRQFVERYPVVLAAVVIYVYYLVTSLNFFAHHAEKRSFVDYIMQFDSLFFLWIAAALLLQVQRLRKERKEESSQHRTMERVLDRQQIYTHLINDITALLQDNVNNPLAVIAVTTQEMRRRFEKDNEIMRWLDRIDGSMQRIHMTIRDLQAYESQKMMESSNEMLNRPTTPPEKK
jgi:signal transduction histidine kinase